MASTPTFQLVPAAEELLTNAKKLAALTKPGDEDNELELRRSIAHTAKSIAFETAPGIDVIKSDWMVMADIAAWNIFIDWKAFDHIPLDGHISIHDLALALNAQESLIARISAQLLATHKLLPGPTPNTLRHSRISPLYRSTHPVSSLCTVAVGNAMKPFAHWPAYFNTITHNTHPHPPTRTTPPTQTNTPFAFAWGHPALSPWEVKALYPGIRARLSHAACARW